MQIPTFDLDLLIDSYILDRSILHPLSDDLIASRSSPFMALLGNVSPIPITYRRFTAIALLLAKREIALHWGNSVYPTTKAWLHSPTYCDLTSEVYSSLQPPTARPKDIWQPQTIQPHPGPPHLPPLRCLQSCYPQTVPVRTQMHDALRISW